MGGDIGPPQRRSRTGNALRTVVHQSGRWRLRIGAVLPPGRRVSSVLLDGRPTDFHTLSTARGPQVVADGGNRAGTTDLLVRLRSGQRPSR